jgi:hypothetical protein
VANKVEAAYRRTDPFEKRRALMQQWGSSARPAPVGSPAGAVHARRGAPVLSRPLIRDARYAIDHGDTIFAPEFKAFLKDVYAVGTGRPISPSARSLRIGAALTASWTSAD